MNVAELLREMSSLHFLRPLWFYALIALPPLAWWWRVQRRKRNAWRDVVDPNLLPQLLETSGDRRSRFTFWFAALGFPLAVLAMAGPSWRQSAQPLWQSRTPLVIALDLSSATMAADLPPSRLAQARAKLATLLHERRGGQVGLVHGPGRYSYRDTRSSHVDRPIAKRLQDPRHRNRGQQGDERSCSSGCRNSRTRHWRK